MLEDKIKGFIAYCKVAGFKDKSLETFSLRLNEFNKFLNSKRFRNIQSVTYSHLSAFVADFKSPSVHIKKARIWSLHQFFHFLKLKCHRVRNYFMHFYKYSPVISVLSMGNWGTSPFVN